MSTAQATSNQKQKQAIVLIHGIGEQHPIVTLRGFVEPLADYLKNDLGEARHDEVLFWDKPDPVSGNYETRKLTMRRGRNHDSTDFYEFYWAHHMRNTNFSHIKDWLQHVVFRRPRNVSPRLATVFYFLWFLIFLTVGIVVYSVIQNGFDNTVEKMTAISSGVVVVLVLGFISRLLFNYLGDAARYLDPSPGNIAERQAIREEGVKLLRSLHESGSYSRIVVVSHSLGSVIAYDLLKFLWNEYYWKFDNATLKNFLATASEPEFDAVAASEIAGAALKENKISVDEFQAAQGRSFNYLKTAGNPWLITDLVTIGSPLAHAGHLFAGKRNLFDKLIEQREYPVSPPHFQADENSNIRVSKKPHEAVKGRKLKYFNHSSPFAVVKWTNIYYSSDFVGGPLKGVFGKGIKDIHVHKKKGINIYPAGHTSYWNYHNKKHVLKELWEILDNK